MTRPRRGSATSPDSQHGHPRVDSRPEPRGHLPRAPVSLGPEQIEPLRFPGEASAALGIRRTRGFADESRRLDLEDQLRPPARKAGWGMRREDGELRAIVDEVAALVGVPGPVEIYQHAGVPRAWVAGQPGGVHLHFSPGLGDLSGVELRAMIGEALGTWQLHLCPEAPERAAIRVALAWRSASLEGPGEARKIRSGRLLTACEISADRLALVAAGGLEPYLTAEMKQGTAIGEAAVRYEPRAFLQQIREALEESLGPSERAQPRLDRYVRVRAAELFAASDAFHDLTGWGQGAKPLSEVNLEVARLLAGWVPRWSDRIPPLEFERFLLAAGGAIAAADGRFSREERDYLALMLPGAWRGRLLGASEASRATEHGAAEIRRLDDARARAMTLTFLCGLVDADGRAHDAELAAIDHVGRVLGARELFRGELWDRYGFNPALYSPGTGAKKSRSQAPIGVLLERYLNTVVLVGERQSTPRRLLRLGGFPRRTPRVIEAVQHALTRLGLEAQQLDRAGLDEPLPIRVRRPARG